MNNCISDEILARYLSGKATPEEEAAVLDYLSESDGRIDDLLAMSAAVEQFEKENTRRLVRPLWPILAVAASVLLIICIGFTLRISSPSGSSVNIDRAPTYATSDTMVDSLVEIEYE